MRLTRLVLLAFATAGAQPPEAREQVNLGVTAYKNAQYPLAAAYFTEAICLDPEYVTARLYLGTTYMGQYIPGADSPENVRLAELAEQQMPCRSSSRSAAEDSIPSNERLDVFGIRGAPAPFTDAPLTVSSAAFSNRSRMDWMLHFPSARCFAASSAAFPRPTIDATFSVPPLRPFSWPPPAINGLKRVRLLT